ncbi:MAG: HAD-IIA family hydrolase [Candidatus Bipolaricaulaceae bacterium]
MLNRYKGFLLDIDGVLLAGGRALPGAAQALEELRHEGKVLLLTNNSTKSRRGTAERLASAGIPATPEEVLPSSYIAARFLRSRFGAVRFWLIGEEGILAEMAEAGHVLVSPKEAEWLVVGMDRGLTYEKLALALQALLRGAKLLATNEDPTFPTPEGLVPGAGAVVGALRGMGFPPEFVVGKPSPISFQIALESLGASPKEVLMIGDRLDTDIAGAQTLGMDTALVLSGVTTLADLAKAGIRPTYVAADLLALVRGKLISG